MGLSFNKQWFREPQYSEEGRIPYTYDGCTYEIWYGKIGFGAKPPVLVLHGGPGGNHHNLVSFQALEGDREVIFYDQLGCGNSDRPENDMLWTAERYFEEAEVVCKALDLKEFHLVGHSWGTTIAAAMAFNHPEGILSLTLHSPIVSFPHYVTEVAPKLKVLLPGNTGEIIDNFELKGIGDENRYEEAVMEHVKRFVTRTWPLPAPMERLISEKNHRVQKIMVGSVSELNVLGNLAEVDLSGYLSSLLMPVLLTCGEWDLCTPEFTRWQYSLVPHAEMKIIPKSAHMTPVDNPEDLLTAQNGFLLKNE